MSPSRVAVEAADMLTEWLTYSSSAPKENMLVGTHHPR